MALKTLEKRRKKQRPAGSLRFVVHKHWARRLHHDFRLEHGGVLKSWAVPKDLPVRAGERKLAVLVEDHPLDYRTFEGTIPRGSYGAGTVIIWDEGSYRVSDSAGAADSERRFAEEFAKGRLEIDLSGAELNGRYALVRMAGRGKKWLLIKKKDTPRAQGRPEENPIVVSGHSEKKGLSKLDLTGARRRATMPASIEPMPALPRASPFDRAGWIFEVKWDGCRAITSVERGSVSIYSSDGKLLNYYFPAITRSLRGLSYSALFDGAIVALDREGRPDPRMLREYLADSRGRVVYYIFDILYLNGYDLRPMTLLRRKKVLSQVLAPGEHVAPGYFVREGGLSLFKAASENGFSGMIAKNGESPYREGGKTGDWLKINVTRRKEERGQKKATSAD